VKQGDYNVNGVAVDGVTGAPLSVDLFLGSRDAGGTYLGTAMPGSDLNNPNNPAAFSQEVTFPSVNRLDTFTAYATSTHGAGTTTVSVPIRIGSPPPAHGAQATPTPIASSTTVKSNCPTVAVGPAGGVHVTGTSAPVVAVRPNQGPVLQIANPQSGDFVSHGDYISFGVAFDPNSSSGPGVDLVSYYLGSRDSGGNFIGSGVPGVVGGPPEGIGGTGSAGAYTAELTFPANASGLHDVVAYAHSSLTGRETSVTITVNIGARLTPTPTS
jgi:hypothetical protein